MRAFFRQGEPFIWMCGAALTVAMLITTLLLVVVAKNGLGYFWPSPVVRVELKDKRTIVGEIVRSESRPDGKGRRLQFKIGNRDWYGLDFTWVDADQIERKEYPRDAVVFERKENGNFFGFLRGVTGQELPAAAEGSDLWNRLSEAREIVHRKRRDASVVDEKIHSLTSKEKKIDQRIKRIEYWRGAGSEEKLERLLGERAGIIDRLEVEMAESAEWEADIRSIRAEVVDGSGREGEVVVDDILRAYRPNRLSTGRKCVMYLDRVRELLLDEPRESNQEGGLFPAIFGTVLMVFLMSIFCVPLGVVAAIYLREYAKEGILVRVVRIGVNNLAGVPSIVYGIFGLGFFVYGIGSLIDRWFFPERLPESTYGTGGILWASLTLALLTVPVVIVSTEEALAAIPSGIREGSIGLGATRFQTLWRTVLPMASPGIMTGFILSMARAAGEVAPLMLLGMVKLAPKLVDGEFPYFHPDRKFMHLGHHIYDLGFQSPNVEAVRPMIYVTTMLLLAVVISMSGVAILLRNRMKKRYTQGAF